ncbi:hypothetical protein ACOSQ4_024556 [Xanthoceras sorbifolium]
MSHELTMNFGMVKLIGNKYASDLNGKNELRTGQERKPECRKFFPSNKKVAGSSNKDSIHRLCKSLCASVVNLEMATEQKTVTEDAKIDLFEDDDEFEEFEINEEWEDKEEGKDVTQQWEDDWDDDDVNDDFSLQLRRELENNTEKN